ncbi:ABC transporter ATP-binding protein [Paractinoplanes deccanensis]|uniref:ABC transporter ATP-binding protein n=1 Tax=Paractinoplanes deccanensis TaxID=113561 RepID=A0ABQ3XWF2_9ACTN|nr:ATP-binding cassette domain-containing protein [Actinoplanes deccanensis]GID72050.1 ABC transporter ATP-binding protein [Actinoplanes deccanensis]
MTSVLHVDGVSRAFDGRPVLSEVSFQVAGGRMTGFVGANGAGKTTTMRIILGVLAADSGDVLWRGKPLSREVRQRFGYMPEERGLYPKMSVMEQIVYLGQLHGLSRASAAGKATKLLDRLGLGERAGEKLEKLSLGNQQRAQVAAALVHDPEMLVLDEPFSGLDPLAVDVVVDVLRERAASGVPVLFSSHQLELVERLCDDLVIIAGGTIRAAGDRARLRESYALPRFQLHTGADVSWLASWPGVTVVESDGTRAVIDLADGADDQKLLRAALDRGAVRSFGPVSPTLAEIFREVIR